MKRAGAMLLMLALVVAPMAGLQGGAAPKPACGLRSDCCSTPAGHAPKPACTECALCAVACCLAVFSANDTPIAPAGQGAALRCADEIGASRSEPPPLPPPRGMA